MQHGHLNQLHPFINTSLYTISMRKLAAVTLVFMAGCASPRPFNVYLQAPSAQSMMSHEREKKLNQFEEMVRRWDTQDEKGPHARDIASDFTRLISMFAYFSSNGFGEDFLRIYKKFSLRVIETYDPHPSSSNEQSILAKTLEHVQANPNTPMIPIILILLPRIRYGPDAYFSVPCKDSVNSCEKDRMDSIFSLLSKHHSNASSVIAFLTNSWIGFVSATTIELNKRLEDVLINLEKLK